MSGSNTEKAPSGLPKGADCLPRYTSYVALSFVPAGAPEIVKPNKKLTNDPHVASSGSGNPGRGGSTSQGASQSYWHLPEDQRPQIKLPRPKKDEDLLSGGGKRRSAAGKKQAPKPTLASTDQSSSPTASRLLASFAAPSLQASSASTLAGEFSPSVSPMALSPSMPPVVMSSNIAPSVSPTVALSLFPTVAPNFPIGSSPPVNPSVSSTVSLSSTVAPTVAPTVAIGSSPTESLVGYSPNVDPSVSLTVAPSLPPTVALTAASAPVSAVDLHSPRAVDFSPFFSVAPTAPPTESSSSSPSSSPEPRSSLRSFCAAPPKSWQPKSASVAISSTGTIENLIPVTTSTPAVSLLPPPASSTSTALRSTGPAKSIPSAAVSQTLPESSFWSNPSVFLAASSPTRRARPNRPVSASNSGAVLFKFSDPLVTSVAGPTPAPAASTHPVPAPSSKTSNMAALAPTFSTPISSSAGPAKVSAPPNPTASLSIDNAPPAQVPSNLWRLDTSPTGKSIFSARPVPALAALAPGVQPTPSPPSAPMREMTYPAPRDTRIPQTSSASSISPYPTVTTAWSRHAEQSAPQKLFSYHPPTPSAVKLAAFNPDQTTHEETLSLMAPSELAASSSPEASTRSSNSSLPLITAVQTTKEEAGEISEGTENGSKVPKPKIAKPRQGAKAKGRAWKEALGNNESPFKINSVPAVEKLTKENAALKKKNEDLEQASAEHEANLEELRKENEKVVEDHKKNATESVNQLHLRNAELKKQLDDKIASGRKENAALREKNAELEKVCADHIGHLEQVKKGHAKVIENLKKAAKDQLHNPDLEKAELKKQLQEKTASEKMSQGQVKKLKDTVLISGEMVRLLQEENDRFKQDHKGLSTSIAGMQEERAAHNSAEVKNVEERSRYIAEVKYLSAKLDAAKNPGFSYANMSLNLDAERWQKILLFFIMLYILAILLFGVAWATATYASSDRERAMWVLAEHLARQATEISGAEGVSFPSWL